MNMIWKSLRRLPLLFGMLLLSGILICGLAIAMVLLRQGTHTSPRRAG